MVVSLVPHSTVRFERASSKSFPGRPFVTVLTDLADYPAHFWIERQQQYLVCAPNGPSNKPGNGTFDQAIFQTSGMILHRRVL